MIQTPSRSEEEWQSIAYEVQRINTYEHNTQVRPLMHEKPTCAETVRYLLADRRFNEDAMIRCGLPLVPIVAKHFSTLISIKRIDALGKRDPLEHYQDNEAYVRSLAEKIEQEDLRSATRLRSGVYRIKEEGRSAKDLLNAYLGYHMSLCETYRKHMPKESACIRFLKKLPFLDDWIDLQQRDPAARVIYPQIRMQREALRALARSLGAKCASDNNKEGIE